MLPVMRLDRHGVVAGVDERAQALVLQAARLREQAFSGARHAVGAEAADHRRHTARDGVRQQQLGRARREAALAAAAHHVDVAVDEAGDGHQAARVDDVAEAVGHAQAGLDADDPPAGDEDVGAAGRGRGEGVDVFQQQHAGTPLRAGQSRWVRVDFRPPRVDSDPTSTGRECSTRRLLAGGAP